MRRGRRADEERGQIVKAYVVLRRATTATPRWRARCRIT
jgi:acyl-coenzyme A synthetase/AMP-(fatty) acid ligase